MRRWSAIVQLAIEDRKILRELGFSRCSGGKASAMGATPARRTYTPCMNDIRDISQDEARVAELVRSARRVAVLGIKIEAQADQPAFYVPSYLQSAGVEVIPVPVYYPDVKTILGQPVYRRVADVPGPIDIVVVFRRGQDVTAHLADLLAARPRAVWLQLGIRNDRVAERLVEAGILVVQSRCLMVDHRRVVGQG